MAPRPAHGWLEALSLPVMSEHRKEAKLVEGSGGVRHAPVSEGASLPSRGVSHTAEWTGALCR